LPLRIQTHFKEVMLLPAMAQLYVDDRNLSCSWNVSLGLVKRQVTQT